jgi:hypothetical protein
VGTHIWRSSPRPTLCSPRRRPGGRR